MLKFTRCYNITYGINVTLCHCYTAVVIRRGAGTSSLESIGVMTHTLTVQASDDVYQKTLVKMSLAEEESKKARYVPGIMLEIFLVRCYIA